MTGENSAQQQNMRDYYRWHAAVYDATRWSFLFERGALLQKLPLPASGPASLLEVGCGTGHNLRLLARKFPELHLTGVDVSPDMLQRTARSLAQYSQRVQLFEQAYGATPLQYGRRPDVILFSYALTMFNPGWEAAIEQALQELEPGAYIAVVDFHDTPSRLFRRWMGHNHVRMEGHLLPRLQAHFRTVLLDVHPAWAGLWRYFLFVGQKEPLQ